MCTYHLSRTKEVPIIYIMSDRIKKSNKEVNNKITALNQTHSYGLIVDQYNLSNKQNKFQAMLNAMII